MASQLVARDLDTARAIGAANLTSTSTTLPPVTIGGQTYYIQRDVIPYAPGVSGCGVGTQTSVRVTTTVSWYQGLINQGQVASTHTTLEKLVGTTIITATPGTYTTGTGAFGVSVVDQDNHPLAGVPRDVHDRRRRTAGTTRTTNSEGCAALEGLTAGTTYTAWLGNSPTWVPQGFRYGVTPTPYSGSGSITANGVVTFSGVYGQAASIKLDVNTDATHPVPANMPFTIYNSSFPNSTQTFSTTWVKATGTQPMTTAGTGLLTAASFPYVFPSTSGYTPWAGDCADADPGTTSTPSYRGANIATPPGA